MNLYIGIIDWIQKFADKVIEGATSLIPDFILEPLTQAISGIITIQVLVLFIILFITIGNTIIALFNIFVIIPLFYKRAKKTLINNIIFSIPVVGWFYFIFGLIANFFSFIKNLYVKYFTTNYKNKYDISTFFNNKNKLYVFFENNNNVENNNFLITDIVNDKEKNEINEEKKKENLEKFINNKLPKEKKLK